MLLCANAGNLPAMTAMTHLFKSDCIEFTHARLTEITSATEGSD